MKKRKRGKNPKWMRIPVFAMMCGTAFATLAARLLTRRDVIRAVESNDEVKLLLVKSKATRKAK